MWPKRNSWIFRVLDIWERYNELQQAGYSDPKSGAGGTVYFSPCKTHVVKVAHDPGSKEFFQYIQTAANNSFLPKMSDFIFEENWCSAKIEFLLPLSETNITQQQNIVSLVQAAKGVPALGIISPDLHQVLSHTHACALSSGCFWDICKVDNWMERGDGQLVLTDPFT